MKAFTSKLKETGFFHIFSSQVLCKIITFCGSFFVAGIIEKADNGVFSNSNTIINMFLLLSGLGTASAMVQFGSENYKNPEKKKAYLNFGFRIGSVFNLLLVVFIILYALFMPLNIAGTQSPLLLLSFWPIAVYLNDVIATCFRVDLKNKSLSYFNTSTTAMIFLATIGGAFLGGVMGIIKLRYIAYVVVFGFAIFVNRDSFSFLRHPINLVHNEKLLFLKISVISAINNGISQLVLTIDSFFVAMFIKDAVVLASYNVGSQIPYGMLFIPQCIMFYVYPYFAMHNNDMTWVKKQYTKLFKIMLILSLAITVATCLFAPPILSVVFRIFHKNYDDCIPVLQVLMISFFFASVFKIPSGNILVTLKKLKINFYLAIISCLLNIVLDIVFIKIWGSMGAAVATLSVNIIVGACSTIYLHNYLKNNTNPPLPKESESGIKFS